MINLSETADFAKKLSLKVGKLLLEQQAQVKIDHYKIAQDITTNVDLEAEKLIIKAIQEKYPDHNIYSEEKGWLRKKSDFTWYTDPLDGTKEYYKHIPNYNISFVLFHKNKPILAVVYVPYANQLFYADYKNGAFLNKVKINVNKETNLAKSVLYFHPPSRGGMKQSELNKEINKLKLFSKLAYRIRVMPNQNTFLCYLALGSIEAFINNMNPVKYLHDLAPGLFISKMAGAKITNLNGKSFDYRKDRLFIASNGKLHSRLLKLINF